MPDVLQSPRTHACDFIISEGAGHISRENVTIAASQTIVPGTLLYASAPGVYSAVSNTPPSPGTAVAIAMYGVVTEVGEVTTKIAAIVRDAEVNGHQLVWPEGTVTADQTLFAALLAAQHVIMRGLQTLA